ncbi:hypothetical protein VSDG_06345 [Cytospora chrysosperma]|uniref:Uncharacterized protein n=1 Tax=Cytospora chrysosperma TaxID=252740 RepID=A0A423VPU0_CYTCH|nr:hypothetical protein VSDG_06345 [Valsa sordida]
MDALLADWYQTIFSPGPRLTKFDITIEASPALGTVARYDFRRSLLVWFSLLDQRNHISIVANVSGNAVAQYTHKEGDAFGNDDSSPSEPPH